MQVEYVLGKWLKEEIACGKTKDRKIGRSD